MCGYSATGPRQLGEGGIFPPPTRGEFRVSLYSRDLREATVRVGRGVCCQPPERISRIVWCTFPTQSKVYMDAKIPSGEIKMSVCPVVVFRTAHLKPENPSNLFLTVLSCPHIEIFSSSFFSLFYRTLFYRPLLTYAAEISVNW